MLFVCHVLHTTPVPHLAFNPWLCCPKVRGVALWSLKRGLGHNCTALPHLGFAPQLSTMAALKASRIRCLALVQSTSLEKECFAESSTDRVMTSLILRRHLPTI